MNLSPVARVFRFGVFELDTESGELRRHGLKVRLPDQSFQILRTLLLRPGDVVTREELRKILWQGETFVDFEVGLNSAVRKLREALDDSAENPRFVMTLPRRGYRFVGSVGAPLDVQIPAAPAVADQAPAPVAQEPMAASDLPAGGLEIASRQATGHNSRIEAYLGYAYAVAGRAHDAREVLKELEAHRKDQYVSWHGVAVIHDALGEKAPALAALQRAFDDRAVEFGLNDDDYAPFRTIASEPAYQAVIRKVGR
jgi:DNA-binding winged helix-turn-helix (wHTH) protein